MRVASWLFVGLLIFIAPIFSAAARILSQDGSAGDATVPAAATLSDFNVGPGSTIEPSPRNSTRCGPGYPLCPNNECCSLNNYCGNSMVHCREGCQSEFGRCEWQFGDLVPPSPDAQPPPSPSPLLSPPSPASQQPPSPEDPADFQDDVFPLVRRKSPSPSPSSQPDEDPGLPSPQPENPLPPSPQDPALPDPQPEVPAPPSPVAPGSPAPDLPSPAISGSPAPDLPSPAIPGSPAPDIPSPAIPGNPAPGLPSSPQLPGDPGSPAIPAFPSTPEGPSPTPAPPTPIFPSPSLASPPLPSPLVPPSPALPDASPPQESASPPLPDFPPPIPSPPPPSPPPPSPDPPSPSPPPPSPPPPSPPPPSPAPPSPTPVPTPSTDPGAGTYIGETRATYHYYGYEDGGNRYQVNLLYCADAFRDKPQDWLFQYPWTAYCLPYMGGMSQELCGQCLRLTNQRTGNKIVVRIVDLCGHGALDLDWDRTFKPLDNDGSGYTDGRLPVGIEHVPC